MTTRMAPISEEDSTCSSVFIEPEKMEKNHRYNIMCDDSGAFPSSNKSRSHCFAVLEEEEKPESSSQRLPSVASTCGNSTSVSSEDFYSEKQEQEPEEQQLEEPSTTPEDNGDAIPPHVLSSNTSSAEEEQEDHEKQKKMSVDLVKSLQALAKLKPEIPELILLEGAGNHAELETLVSKLTLPEELLKIKRKGWLEDAATAWITSPTTFDLTTKSSSDSSESEEQQLPEYTGRVSGMQLYVQMGRTTHAGWYSGRINEQKQANGTGIIKFDDDEAGVDGMIMYMGEFHESHLHGEGTLVLRGDTLRGEFEYNLYVC
jgi:hypothetical protein